MGKGEKAMLRSKIYVVLTVVLFFGIAIAGLVQAQGVKTIKLPNDEEVVDISGEWDTQIENYGSWSGYKKYSTITEIKQEGGSFVGIRLMATTYHPAGSETFRGELDENGINKLQLMTGMGPIDAVVKISDDWKTIMMDAHEKAR
jgi:hypothetical protein